MAECTPPIAVCGERVPADADDSAPTSPDSTRITAGDIAHDLWLLEVGDSQRRQAWRELLLGGLDSESRPTKDVYDSLCESSCPHDAAIKRDLGRTLPQDALFKEREGSGQKALFRLLRALATRLWDIGYVQSLNFIAATMLGVFWDDEEAAFQCCHALLFRHSLADMYRPKFPKMGVTVWQFDKVVEGFLPEVDAVLKAQGITAEYYALEWFLTLFASELPQRTVRRVWDRFLIAGWRIIVQVGLAVLAQAKGALLGFDDPDDLQTFMKRCARPARRCDVDKLLDSAASFDVSHRMLSELEAAYELGSARLILEWDSVSNQLLTWAVRRGDGVEVGALAGSACDSTADCAAAAALLHAGARKSRTYSDTTMLPFLITNLDTGATSIMDGAWSEFQHKTPEPASQVEASSPALPSVPSNTSGASGGSFYTKSMQHQALQRLSSGSKS